MALITLGLLSVAMLVSASVSQAPLPTPLSNDSGTVPCAGGKSISLPASATNTHIVCYGTPRGTSLISSDYVNEITAQKMEVHFNNFMDGSRVEPRRLIVGDMFVVASTLVIEQSSVTADTVSHDCAKPHPSVALEYSPNKGGNVLKITKDIVLGEEQKIEELDGYQLTAATSICGNSDMTFKTWCESDLRFQIPAPGPSHGTTDAKASINAAHGKH